MITNGANSFAAHKVGAVVSALAAAMTAFKDDLQWIVDHPADCPETERAKLVEQLRYVGGKHYAWADRIANGSSEPPKPSKPEIEQMKLDLDKRVAERVAERAAEAKVGGG